MVNLELEAFYFTFGVGTNYKDKVVKVLATDSSVARHLMIAKYGINFAFQYTEKEYFGFPWRYDIMDTIDAKEFMMIWDANHDTNLERHHVIDGDLSKIKVGDLVPIDRTGVVVSTVIDINDDGEFLLTGMTDIYYDLSGLKAWFTYTKNSTLAAVYE